MNKVHLLGRLTKDPDVRRSQGAESVTIARYTLAVDRRQKKQEGQQAAYFISCVAFVALTRCFVLFYVGLIREQSRFRTQCLRYMAFQ